MPILCRSRGGDHEAENRRPKRELARVTEERDSLEKGEPWAPLMEWMPPLPASQCVTLGAVTLLDRRGAFHRELAPLATSLSGAAVPHLSHHRWRDIAGKPQAERYGITLLIPMISFLYEII